MNAFPTMLCSGAEWRSMKFEKRVFAMAQEYQSRYLTNRGGFVLLCNINPFNIPGDLLRSPSPISRITKITPFRTKRREEDQYMVTFDNGTKLVLRITPLTSPNVYWVGTYPQTRILDNLGM